MPDFVAKALKERNLLHAYRARPPYQRNDYIGWIINAKASETKRKRLAQMLHELKVGGVYMKMEHRPSRKS
jgi:uncharacterized protein YdeI (YjbR/CyaY-like superfamily)